MDVIEKSTLQMLDKLRSVKSTLPISIYSEHNPNQKTNRKLFVMQGEAISRYKTFINMQRRFSLCSDPKELDFRLNATLASRTYAKLYDIIHEKDPTLLPKLYSKRYYIPGVSNNKNTRSSLPYISNVRLERKKAKILICLLGELDANRYNERAPYDEIISRLIILLVDLAEYHGYLFPSPEQRGDNNNNNNTIPVKSHSLVPSHNPSKNTNNNNRIDNNTPRGALSSRDNRGSSAKQRKAVYSNAPLPLTSSSSSSSSSTKEKRDRSYTGIKGTYTGIKAEEDKEKKPTTTGLIFTQNHNKYDPTRDPRNTQYQKTAVSSSSSVSISTTPPIPPSPSVAPQHSINNALPCLDNFVSVPISMYNTENASNLTQIRGGDHNHNNGADLDIITRLLGAAVYMGGINGHYNNTKSTGYWINDNDIDLSYTGE